MLFNIFLQPSKCFKNMRMSKDVSFSQGRSLRNQSSITSICNPVQCLTLFSPVSLKMVRTVLQTDQTREMDTVPSSRSAKASTSDQVEISRPITDRRVPRARAERHHQALVTSSYGSSPAQTSRMPHFLLVLNRLQGISYIHSYENKSLGGTSDSSDRSSTASTLMMQ